MTRYEIANTTSGQSLGIYVADSEADAYIAMLEDADMPLDTPMPSDIIIVEA